MALVFSNTSSLLKAAFLFVLTTNSRRWITWRICFCYNLSRKINWRQGPYGLTPDGGISIRYLLMPASKSDIAGIVGLMRRLRTASDSISKPPLVDFEMGTSKKPKTKNPTLDTIVLLGGIGAANKL